MYANLSNAMSGYVIDGDTLFVCNSFSTTVLFPEAIVDAYTLCPKGEYLLSKKIKQAKGKLDISMGDENPKDTVCILIVTEGINNHIRKHRFVIYHALVLNPDDAKYDYSNLQNRYGKIATPINNSLNTDTLPIAAKGDETIILGNTNINKSQIENLVKQRIEQFNEVVNNLLNKRGNADQNITTGMALFNNDKTKTVAITNRLKEKNLKPIETYFYALSKLNYYETKVTGSKYTFISNFRKNPDGTWHGLASVEQEFDVTNKEGKNVLKDITQKTFDVIIQVTDLIKEDGSTQTKMLVFLGNINVNENR